MNIGSVKLRFGFNGYKALFNNEGRDIEVVNEAENGKEDLLQDLVTIITSFCARLYGQRKCKRRTEKIIQELTEDNAKDISPPARH